MRIFSAGLLMASMVIVGAHAQSSASREDGFRVFKSANCVGCHKWTGTGGGGYGGAAANLRVTELDRDQITEVVRCGRPGTGMPHFEADAYKDGHCYGLKAGDLKPAELPPEPDHYLRPADIEAVTDYVLANIKGHGDPTYAECTAFFGAGSRACTTYPHEGAPASAGAAAPQRLKIDRAGDANAPH